MSAPRHPRLPRLPANSAKRSSGLPRASAGHPMITSAPQDYLGQFRRMREGSATATSASDAGAPPQSLRGTAGSFDIRAGRSASVAAPFLE
jgi:hypothetical protein